MKKGIVIAGFSGIGKTMLGSKYENVVDLDSAEFAYDDSEMQNIPFEKRKGEDRKPNPLWPQNYINAIKDAQPKFDIVLVWDREDIINEYLKNNIDFTLCYPDEKSLKIYKERYRQRGNTEKYVKWKTEQYSTKMKYFSTLDIKKIVLHKNETLEDYLKSQNFNLKEKQR